MDQLVKWFVCGVVFGVGVKGGMKLYDYATSEKGQQFVKKCGDNVTKYFNNLVDPKPECPVNEQNGL